MLKIKVLKPICVSFLIFSFVVTSVFAQNLGDPLDISFFKNSYEESREQFLTLVTELEKNKELVVTKKSYPSPTDPSLITDVVLIKTKLNSTGLQVYNSGLHGIEGFVGSAVQSWILKNKINGKSPSDYLFIHALNPYGFKNKRRVNEANVDLNRNFVTDPKIFQSKNPPYAEISDFLNPSEKVSLNFFSRIQFVFSAISRVLRSSLDTLRRAILIGQYEFPKGISFGGNNPQYQTALISEIYSSFISSYEKVFVVDLHTGYGEKNKLHLLDGSQNQKNAEGLQKVFTNEQIDLGNQKNFYNVNGDLLTYLLKLQKTPDQMLGVAFEFGTANSQTALGAIESLRRMVLENQKYQNQTTDAASATEVENLFLELFYPQNDTFKKMAIEQSSAEISKIEAYFAK